MNVQGTIRRHNETWEGLFRSIPKQTGKKRFDRKGMQSARGAVDELRELIRRTRESFDDLFVVRFEVATAVIGDGTVVDMGATVPGDDPVLSDAELGIMMSYG